VSSPPVWDAWAQRVYLTWLARDIRHAQIALLEIRARAGQPPDPLIWIPLETFLMFTAKVSKMLKPVGVDGKWSEKSRFSQDTFEYRKFRGSKLRAILQVTNNSPVLDRKVRNASEHFDEDLDKWTAEQPRVTAEDLETGASPISPQPPMRKAPDSDSWTIEVAGETLDLTQIEAELQRILDRVTELEPLAVTGDSHLATLLASLAPFPKELTFSAPTRRPEEHVLTGVDPEVTHTIDRQIREAITRCVEAFNSSGNAEDGQSEKNPRDVG
jgi:hypothetical protein